MEALQSQANATSSADAVSYAQVALGGDPTRPSPLLADAGFLAHTPVVQLADRYFGEYADYGLALAFAVALPFLRAALDFVIFKPLGRLVIAKGRRPTLDERALIYKWKESGWKSVVYLSFAILAFEASYHESWFTRRRAMWEGCTQLPCNFVVPKLVRLLYCLEMGFYLQAIPSAIFWEVRRKDFRETMAHHVATLILIVYSYYLNLTKVGAMVFLLHDVNDIFLEMAKMSRYAGLEALPNVLFLLFTLSWFVSRMGFYPFWVIRSTLYDTLDVARESQVNVHPHYGIFNGFLIFLLVLHIYWSWLILKILWKALRGEPADDIREKDD